MTDVDADHVARLGELFVSVTGTESIRERQQPGLRRTIAADGSEGVSAYVTGAARAHGLDDAIGVSAASGGTPGGRE